LNTTEVNVLRGLVPRLLVIESDLRRGNAVERFPEIRTALERIVKEWGDGLGGLPANVTETDVRFRLDRMRATLAAIVTENEPEDNSLEFTLFEIVQTRTGNSKDEIGTMTTTLREVQDVTVREAAARVHAQNNQ